MPLIWDDNDWKLLDDSEDYDRNRYAIVRKLFIQLKADHVDSEDTGEESPKLTEEFIRKEFRKYGEIESIEPLNNGKPEAYITFTSDRIACLALAESNIRQSSKVYVVNPANTWHQPSMAEINDEEMDQDNDTVPISMLNEDCILKLFEFCDFDALVNLSHVCKAFYSLLHHYRLPHITKLKITDPRRNPSVTLARTRQILQCVGLYIEDLTVEWNEYSGNEKLTRYLQKIGQNIGKRIRVLRLNNLLLDDDLIEYIRPVLHHLHTLEIRVYNADFELDIDFQAFCPNLTKLKLLQNMQLVKASNRPWPNLEHLSIVGNEYMVVETFKAFLEHNPQLKCLKFTAYDCEERFRDVVQYLKNVEKLTILPSFPNITSSNLVYLSSLQHLTTLNLMYLDDVDVNGILDCLNRFVSLRKLKVHVFCDGADEDDHFEPNQRSIITLAQDLPNLEHFVSRNMKLAPATVVDFIRFASKLKIIHIHRCDFFVTRPFITDIVNVRRSNQNRDVLNMFVDVNDRHDSLTFNDSKDVQQYLRASFSCNHIGSE